MVRSEARAIEMIGPQVGKREGKQEQSQPSAPRIAPPREHTARGAHHRKRSSRQRVPAAGEHVTGEQSQSTTDQ